jgi:hypothetical protein
MVSENCMVDTPDMRTHKKPDTPAEFVKFGFFEASSHIEGMHARFDQHEFGVHAHHTWAIGAVVSGAKDVSARRGEQIIVSAGEAYALPPYRPHAGKAVGSTCEYVMLYVPDEEWQAQCVAYGVNADRFSIGASIEPQLTNHLVSFVNLILRHPDRLMMWSGEWANFCESLLRPYRDADLVSSSSVGICADPHILRAHDYLREYWNRNISLAHSHWRAFHESNSHPD